MAAVGSDQIGRVLGDRYRLLAPVGSGASAVVYLADDVSLQRRVAVKLLHPSLAEDPLFLKRFRAEAQAAAALNHPNVVAVYDWGEDHGTPYLVTEFLSGGSLRAMLDRNRLLSPSQALLVALDAARGLDYAHRRGFVHRDVKPANLLFDDDARLRIADFGLARALAEAAWTEPAGVVLGTARYASPEQAKGLAVDGKSDVYSLALVVVESVTGQVPFAADTTVATLMNRVDKLLPVSADLGPLASVVERAGRPDPAERYSAAELGRALIQTAERLPRPTPLPLVPAEVPGSFGDTLLGASPAGRVQPVVSGTESRMAAATAVTAVAPVHDGPPAPPGAGTVSPAVTGNGSARGTAPPAAPPAGTAPVLYDEQPARPRRRRLLWAVLGVLLAVAAVTAGVVVYQRTSTTSYPVPPLVGVEIARARNIVSQYDWEVVERSGRNDTHPKGVVYEQEPASGELEAGAQLILYVSEGPFPSKLPELVGKEQAAALELLDEAGLATGTVTPVYDETVPAGIVMSWSVGGQPLAAGTEVPKGTAVDLSVSQGPKPRKVPDLIGMPYDQAVAKLAELGLVPNRFPDAFSDTIAPGAVAATDPVPNVEVPRGSAVNIAVSKGPDVVTVPNVIGMDLQTAVTTLTQAGLAQGTITGPITGIVQATNPGPTAVVKRGTPVEIVMV